MRARKLALLSGGMTMLCSSSEGEVICNRFHAQSQEPTHAPVTFLAMACACLVEPDRSSTNTLQSLAKVMASISL